MPGTGSLSSGSFRYSRDETQLALDLGLFISWNRSTQCSRS
jgi:hypothetical protein